ncbi:hypothetical protein KIN20_009457 [Parelaphostrongylus tenuis]|uniref:Uncharacterized protein n=1 Tax=Parelaphostrongylus tenuis TaxID=148309 RepID=A0AAD5M9J7_PARTN|nr:hypothetical protein KIN20_009457 [Parelaphostrongylus tenuis]
MSIDSEATTRIRCRRLIPDVKVSSQTGISPHYQPNGSFTLASVVLESLNYVIVALYGDFH